MRDSHQDSHRIVTTAIDALEGRVIGSETEAVTCRACTRRLLEGAPIAVRACHRDRPPTLTIEGVYCQECAPEAPDPDTGGLLATAQLGLVSEPHLAVHRPCLRAVSIEAVGPRVDAPLAAADGDGGLALESED